MKAPLKCFFNEAEKMLAEIFSNQGNVLSEFLTQRVLQYEEPIRKGLPKGTMIGITKKKVWAIFLAAIGYSPKQIYQILIALGVSYGSIRDWFIEPKFNKLVSEFQSEIADRFINQFEKLAETTDTTFLEEPDVWKIFGRAENYGPELTSQILSAVVQCVNEFKSLLFLQTAHSVVSAFCRNLSEEQQLVGHELESWIAINLLSRIYHKTKPPSTVLHPDLEKSQRLSNMLKKYIMDTAIENRFFDLDDIERVVTDDSWVTDDLRFEGKVGLWVTPPPIKSRKGRPRKEKK